MSTQGMSATPASQVMRTKNISTPCQVSPKDTIVLSVLRTLRSDEPREDHLECNTFVSSLSHAGLQRDNTQQEPGCPMFCLLYGLFPNALESPWLSKGSQIPLALWVQQLSIATFFFSSEICLCDQDRGK